MPKLLTGLLLWVVTGVAFSATVPTVHVPSEQQMRIMSASDPHGLIAQIRAALDAGAFANDGAGECEALWWMGRAAIFVGDDAAVTEAAARLDSLNSVAHISLARSYAGFLRSRLRLKRGDGNGVSEALQAAALQIDSPDPRHRALAKYELCDAYSMANQFEESEPFCRDAVAAFVALGDAWGQAQAFNARGNNAYGLGRYADAGQFYRKAQALGEQTGDHSRALMSGDNLAQVYLKQGKPEQALELSRATLADERAGGLEADALISQFTIAQALQAMGRHTDAMQMMASTVEEARKADLDGVLPDFLQEQSRMAEQNGDLDLALRALRDAMDVSRKHWLGALDSQQAELATRYAAREKELRIRELERNNQIKTLKLRTSEAEASRNAMQLRRQRVTLVAAGVAALGLLVGIVSLLLLLRSQRRYARRMRQQALEDPLTGVENRRGFFQRVHELVQAADATSAPLHGLLLFDFDHFKQINDRYGHPFGDIVLNVSLQRLREVVGGRGRLARLGGEEFVALCPRIGGAGAVQLAEEMRTAMATLAFPQAPDGLEVTISIGIALFDGVRCHDVGSWMRSCDQAVYAAKARGRDQVVVLHSVEELLSNAGTSSRGD